MEIIGHIDFDAFFASVEEQEHPWLKGLPVVVGSDPHTGRGAVATANYKARKYGIHSAMAITKAWRISQQQKKEGKQEVVFISPTHTKYGKVSQEVFSYIQTFVPRIQKISVDEAYMDLSKFRSYKQAGLFARKLQKNIAKKYGLDVSVGIGPNKMIAKIASEEYKPRGVCVITPRQIPKFLNRKPVRALPGIGIAAERKLYVRGMHTIEDIKECSWEELEDMFGQNGISLYQKAFGMGSAKIHTEARVAKSIGEEETFVEDTLDLKLLLKRVEGMVDGILAHMNRKKVVSVQTVTIKIRFADFETHTMQTTLSAPTASKKKIYSAAIKLLMPFLEKEKNPQRKDIRLVGVSVSKLIY